MNKVLVSILLGVLVVSCQRKAEAPLAASAPDYKTPPSNTVTDAINATTAALNNRDSAAYWNSLTWEDRDSSPKWYETRKVAQTMWDSSAGSHIDVRIVKIFPFTHTVHRPEDSALFAHAIIRMTISGQKQIYIDSMRSILRVDNGKWLLGSYSVEDMTKPFQVQM
jgi:hypothetical protein